MPRDAELNMRPLSKRSFDGQLRRWCLLAAGARLCGFVAGSAPAQPAQPLWTFDAAGLIRSSPAIGPDGTIYFGARGWLYAITNMGSNAWIFSTQGYVDSSPAVADDGTIYYSSTVLGSPTDGYLYAVKTNGAEEWRYLAESSDGSPAIGQS